jgi:glyoxylase-like metal-dependent hydrolase (beta-lactamase superfamily II)
MAMELKFQDFLFGITCIDTQLHRPEMVACYLVEHKGKAAFIDTGVGNNVPMLLELLRHKSLPLDSVAYVMPTHVHLDHAGGAGALMQALPNAKLVMHPRGARHMIDPSKLQQGSIAVYGEARYQQIFGALVQVPQDRVIQVNHGDELDLNGRKLKFFDTPGHARHHYCVFDELSQGLFTGDTFGASYRELNGGTVPFIFPPTTPVQFDPESWHKSLDLLMSLEPQRIFVTHFGMHENVLLLVKQLHTAIDDYVNIAESNASQSDPLQSISDEIMELSFNNLMHSNVSLSKEKINELLKMDVQLNAQGLVHWLQVR